MTGSHDGVTPNRDVLPLAILLSQSRCGYQTDVISIIIRSVSFFALLVQMNVGDAQHTRNRKVSL